VQEVKAMKELRLSEIRAEAPAGTKSLVLTGRPIVYDQPTTINDPAGKFIEIIKKGALDNADLSDVRLLYNHDLNKLPLARTPNTMQLKTDPAGLTLSAELPDTEEARAVYESVKRGDLSGMSFAFTVPEGGDSYDAGTNTRTITKISKVYECSIVPFPAYPQTSVEARTAQSNGRLHYKARQDAKILINQILREV
jgi:HK97 family phage prohead protease